MDESSPFWVYIIFIDWSKEVNGAQLSYYRSMTGSHRDVVLHEQASAAEDSPWRPGELVSIACRRQMQAEYRFQNHDLRNQFVFFVTADSLTKDGEKHQCTVSKFTRNTAFIHICTDFQRQSKMIEQANEPECRDLFAKVWSRTDDCRMGTPKTERLAHQW